MQEEMAQNTGNSLALGIFKLLLIGITYPAGLLSLGTVIIVIVKGMHCLIHDSKVYEMCESSLLISHDWDRTLVYMMIGGQIVVVFCSLVYTYVMVRQKKVNYVDGRIRKHLLERHYLYHEIPLHGVMVMTVLLGWVIFFQDMRQLDLAILLTASLVLQNLYVAYIAHIDISIPRDEYFSHHEFYKLIRPAARRDFTDYRMLLFFTVCPVLVTLSLYNLCLSVYDIFIFARLAALGASIYSSQQILISSILGRMISAYLHYVIAVFCWKKLMMGDTDPLHPVEASWKRRMEVSRETQPINNSALNIYTEGD